MATALVSIEPECSICLGNLVTPKVLSCGHTFCLSCIERCIANRRVKFPCPFCNQEVRIPEGGATMLTTNFILQPSKHPTQPKCPNHKRRQVEYYCNNCNIGLCSKCIVEQHKDHEILNIECDETRNKAIEKLQCSQKIIKNRIKNLKKTRSTLLESFELLKSMCEDSCAKVTEKTEQIVSDLKKKSEQIKTGIRKNLKENGSKVVNREKEITSEILLLESEIDLNISPSTLNLLLALHPLIEIEKLGESRIDYNLCMQYLQWVGKDFSLDIDQIGSVISKSSHILSSYQFLFDIDNIGEDCIRYNSTDKFRYNNLVWNCCVLRTGGVQFCIGIELLAADNSRLNYCIIDYEISLLNIHDDSKTITETDSEKRLDSGDWCRLQIPITWSKFTDKNNGYLTSNGQFVIQYDITQIREMSWK